MESVGRAAYQAGQALARAFLPLGEWLGSLRLDFAGCCPDCSGRVFRVRTMGRSRSRSRYLGFICAGCGRKLTRREIGK